MMTLEADRIIDRRRLKRRLTFWRIATVVALVVAGLAMVGKVDEGSVRSHVARLTVEGLIISDPERDATLDEAAERDRVKALIIDIDSPGGTVVGGETLYRAIRRVAEKKPVVAVMRETGASAAYMTALGADHIVAHDGTVTGSIGVLMQHADLTGLLDKIGIKPENVKSGPLKAQPNPMEPFTEEAREATRGVIMDLYDMFVDMVAERRSMDRATAKKLADGRIYTGRQAKENGLIDALGGEPEARRWLAEVHGIDEDVPVQDLVVEREQSLIRRLLDEMEGKALFSERLKLDGLVSVWHPSLK